MNRQPTVRRPIPRLPSRPGVLRVAALALLALSNLPAASLGLLDATHGTAAIAQSATPSPTPSPTSKPKPTPTPRPTPRPSLDQPGVPVRVQVPSLGIDLAVVSSRVTLPGNQPGYPLCDVAHYWTRFDLPGAPGTAWIFAHAQKGMFLPLLEEAIATNGRGLLGREIKVQLHDSRVLTYRINTVRQHATDTSIAKRKNPSAHRLVLQTSEGVGDDPKLTVTARLIWARFTTVPAPKPRPRLCTDPPGRPTPRPTARPARKPQPSPEVSPEVSPGISPAVSPGVSPATSSEPSPFDTFVDEPPPGPPSRALLAMMGAGATFLAGSLLLTVWLRRRPVT